MSYLPQRRLAIYSEFSPRRIAGCTQHDFTTRGVSMKAALAIAITGLLVATSQANAERLICQTIPKRGLPQSTAATFVFEGNNNNIANSNHFRASRQSKASFQLQAANGRIAGGMISLDGEARPYSGANVRSILDCSKLTPRSELACRSIAQLMRSYRKGSTPIHNFDQDSISDSTGQRVTYRLQSVSGNKRVNAKLTFSAVSRQLSHDGVRELASTKTLGIALRCQIER